LPGIIEYSNHGRQNIVNDIVIHCRGIYGPGTRELCYGANRPDPFTSPSTQRKPIFGRDNFKEAFTTDFFGKGVTLEQISQLLWAAQGIADRKDNIDLRTAPSSGALYPMELYVLTREGLFHYVPKGHYVETVRKEDMRAELSAMALHQEVIKFAPMTIVISAVYQRVTDEYGQRGERYTHMEAGHIAQNIHLQAVSLGLSSVPMGAFEDKKVKNLLSLPPDQEPLYIISVGYAD